MVERRNAARFQVVEARPNPEQECSANEVRVLLGKAFDRLGPLYAEVPHMYHVQELSAMEAARILGVPVGTVKARLHERALGFHDMCGQYSYAEGELPLSKTDAARHFDRAEPRAFEHESPLGIVDLSNE